MKRSLVLTCSLILCSTTMIGCANSEIKELRDMQALETESTVKSVQLSANEKASEVYSQVSSRMLLDLTSLDSVSESDVGSVTSFMSSVNSQLQGEKEEDEGVLQDDFVSYLLYEMQKTPYTWQMEKTQIRGMDTSSRSIVVDVDFKTTGTEKEIKLDTPIPKGCPNYSQLVKVRYERWLEICKAETSNSSTLRADLPEMKEKFVNAYGDPNEIIEAQNEGTLAKRMYETKQLDTYNCMINPDNQGIGATMTVRFILVPKYVMGVNLGLSCKHMYLINYKLDSDPTEGYTVNTDEGNDTIDKNIDELLHSYYTAIDESNHMGLYSLTKDYQKWDKHNDDLFQATYRKNRGYTISLFNVNGTQIRCGVTLSRSVRAKGSEMTFPTYNERYLYTLELVDDRLKVVDETLLSSEITGEPVIVSESAETSGFKTDVVLSNDDKKALEQLIADSGVVQLKGDFSSQEFGNVVDLNLSTAELTSIKSELSKITASKKSCWITKYLQGFSNYASIAVRELYQKEDGTLYEANTTIDFIHKGDKWYVYSYTINDLNKLDSTTFSSKNSLCTVTADGIENFKSMIDISNTETDIDKAPTAQ